MFFLGSGHFTEKGGHADISRNAPLGQLGRCARVFFLCVFFFSAHVRA